MSYPYGNPQKHPYYVPEQSYRPATSGQQQQQPYYGQHQSPSGTAYGAYPPTNPSSHYPPSGSPAYPPPASSSGPTPYGYPPPPGSQAPPAQQPHVAPMQGNVPPAPAGADPQVWSWFVMADASRNGKLGLDELHLALRNGHWPPFEQNTARLMLNLFDVSHKGEIDFNAFTAIVKYIRDWLAIFERFDKDRSGTIDRLELKQALQAFGYNLNDNVMGSILHRYDVKKCGSISFDAFLHCCVSIRSLTQSFQKYDTAKNGTATINYDQFLDLVFKSA